MPDSNPPLAKPGQAIRQQFTDFHQTFSQTELAPWLETLMTGAEERAFHLPNGKRHEWFEALAALPHIQPSSTDFDAGCIRIGQSSDASPQQQALLKSQLQQFIPWRKGPFELFGIHIDTEWRSDWKWQRIAKHISPLKNKQVLDIGCGSGYHLWRMYAQGAQCVLGIDPSLFFLMQFQCIRHYADKHPVYFLPLRSEDLPDFRERGFDTAFSMGVLYHRRSPLQHLQELKNSLVPGGELILETLVIDQGQQNLLMPENRYAKMRNVWFIPSVSLLELWLKRLGFLNIRCVDISTTRTAEQRATPWMQFESLTDFLDPTDPGRTIEGYPAPIRATIIANRPN